LYSSASIIRYTKFAEINTKEMDGILTIHDGYEKYTVSVGNYGSRTTSETGKDGWLVGWLVGLFLLLPLGA
jgi:hypothetical protein